MPFSAGTYTLPALNPVVTNQTISSTWANNTMSDIATALSTCVLKDGSQTVTANIPMAGFKFTGLGAGSASGNSVRYEQIIGVVTTAGDIVYATGAGAFTRLAIGTSTHVLRSTGTAPEWGAQYIPQNSQSADYTLVIGDAGKHILHPSADTNNRTFTIPANSSVAFETGTTITIVNQVNTITIAITTDTLTMSPTGLTGSRTLAASGIATALKVTSTSWVISGSGLT